MSGTHGELFNEIGKIVLAAHAGQPIDLKKKSEELASRYWNLGVSADTLARALARSLGAVGVSMAVVSHQNGSTIANGHGNSLGNGHDERLAAAENGGPVRLSGEADHADAAAEEEAEGPAKTAAALFPSGVRLAVLS